MQGKDNFKTAGNKNGTVPHREHRSWTRRFLSPSRHPVLSGEKFSRILLIVLCIIFTLFVFCLSVFYIYLFFEFKANIACRKVKEEQHKDLFICSKKTQPG